MSWTGLPDLWTPFPFPADFLFSCFLSFCPFTHFPILYTHVPCLSISPSVLPISLFCPFPQACLLPIPHFNNFPFLPVSPIYCPFSCLLHISPVYCLFPSLLIFPFLSTSPVYCPFSSFQFKMVSMHSEKPICAPPRLSEVSPTLPLKQFQMFV